MSRPPSLLVFTFTLAAIGAAAAEPARDIPWLLLHDGAPVARFVDHHDNALQCSQARFERGRMNEDNVWRCAADVQAVVTSAADAAGPEREARDQGASVVIHAKNTNPPRYPAEAVRSGIAGTTVLRVDVAIDGSVERIEVSASSGSDALDAAASAAAARWVYRPAIVGGRPEPGLVSIPVRFALE